MHPNAPVFPTPLDLYPAASSGGLLSTLAERLAYAPFNAVATGIFMLAIAHPFAAARVALLAHRVQPGRDERRRALGLPPMPSVPAELLHLLGEVEVVFGLWA